MAKRRDSFKFARNLRKIEGKIHGRWRQRNITASHARSVISQIDVYISSGDGTTRRIGEDLKKQLVNVVIEDERRLLSGTAPTPAAPADTSLYAATKQGQVGRCDPSRLNRQRGRDPYFNLQPPGADSLRYYVHGNIPPDWSGLYQIERETGSGTAFVVRAVSSGHVSPEAKPLGGRPGASTPDTTTIADKVRPAPPVPRTERPSRPKPDVSLADVDAKKAPRTEALYTLLLFPGGPRARPWEVNLTRDYLMNHTIGDLLDHPGNYTRTRPQREAYSAVSAETKGSYSIKVGGETYRRTTPLRDVFGVETQQSVVIQKERPRGEKVKQGPVAKPQPPKPRRTVRRGTVARTTKVG